MKSPFDFVDSGNNSIKTNNFDWTHVNNFSTALGRITPIFCQLVPAHTGLSINPRLGLNFMPMVFPLQSRVNARVSFFKVPLRTLWKDYKDFVGNFREGLTEPYIDFKGHCPKTGSLYDYLGLPTTLTGAYGQSEDFNWNLFSGLFSESGELVNSTYANAWTTLASVYNVDDFLPPSSSLETRMPYVQVHNVGHKVNSIYFTYPVLSASTPVQENAYVKNSRFFILPVQDDGSIHDYYAVLMSSSSDTVKIDFPFPCQRFVIAFTAVQQEGLYLIVCLS